MKKLNALLFVMLGTLGTAYAAQPATEQPTYIMRISAEKPDEQVSFMLSYMTASYNGEISHYQITKSTPWEVKVTANQFDILLNSLTRDEKLHLAISSVTNDKEKIIATALGQGIVAEENNNDSRITAF